MVGMIPKPAGKGYSTEAAAVQGEERSGEG